MLRRLSAFLLVPLFAAAMQAQVLPGSGEDLQLRVAIGAPPSGPPTSPVPATGGDHLFVSLDSAAGSANFAPVFLFAEARFGPPTTTSMLGLWIGTPGGVVTTVVGATYPVNLGSFLAPGGNHYLWALPLGFSGFEVVFQAISLIPSAANSFAYFSDAVELLLL